MGPYIPQRHLDNIERLLAPGKAVVVYGARRTGKTTLVRHYLERYTGTSLYVTGDDIAARDYLGSQSIQKLRQFVGSAELLAIDEAQYVPHIGLNLKLIVDHIPGVKVLVTGSSSFGLSNTIGEPLTGRQYTLRMYPLSQLELAAVEAPHETAARLETRLILGSYPEVVTMGDNRLAEQYLRELVSSYLFKDILEHEGVRNADKLTRLLQLLAFQIGAEASTNELGAQLGMSKNTVDRYLDLLEKTFVIFHRTGLSRNLRKEVSKSRRYYFVDTGIRNALIQNFNPVSLRDDMGQLWENYAVVERLKRRALTLDDCNSYFWRTYDNQEIDLVEEQGGRLAGYEMKWTKRKVRPPKAWSAAYPEAGFEAISRDNYLSFITGGADEPAPQ